MPTLSDDLILPSISIRASYDGALDAPDMRYNGGNGQDARPQQTDTNDTGIRPVLGSSTQTVCCAEVRG